MIAIGFKTVEDAIKVNKDEISDFTAEIRSELQKLRAQNLTKVKKDYLDELIKIAKTLITAKPETIRKYKNKLEKIIPGSAMESKQFEGFRNKILKSLGYASKRSNFYPKYFYSIGIKACVYCNSQLAVSIEEEKKKAKTLTYKAKFQVDHYMPKSRYPGLSISLFNLYPVCGSCNNSKSKQELSFSLYQDSTKITPSQFRFILDKVSIAKYLLTKNSDDIIFSFDEPAVASPYKSFEEVLNVQGIYNTQKDLAEELILKSIIYTPKYKETLQKQYPQLFNSAGIFNRIILGNYSSEKEIHKRPMAKFTIDIAKQVGLFKKK